MKMNERKSELNITYIGIAAVIAKAFGLDAMLQKIMEVQAWMPVETTSSENFYYVILAIVLGYGAQRYGVKRLGGSNGGQPGTTEVTETSPAVR